MANWWEAAPLVEQPKTDATGGNWWDVAPLVEQQQAPVLEENTLGGAGMTWMENAINGIPLVGPSIQKGSDYLGSNLYGLMTGQDPAQIREDVNKRREGRNEAYPASAFSGQMAGAIAGTAPLVAAAPAAFGAGSGGWAVRSAASAGSGMALGGSDAFIRSDGDLTSTAIGGGLGLIGGAAGTVLGDMVGAGVRKFRDTRTIKAAAEAANMEPSALKYLNKAASNDGLDAAAMRQQLAELGPDAKLMDLSPNLEGAAGALANRPGEAQTIIRDALAQRQIGANQRIVAGLDDALGPVHVKGSRGANETIREGQRGVGPAYDEAFEDALPVDTSQIAETLERQAFTLRGDAQKAARDMRKMLNVANGDILDANPRTLLQTRNAIDGKMATEADANTIRVYKNARQQIDETLANNVPGIKMADAQFQELARQNEGLRIGVKALDSGREALRPDELQQAIIEGVNPEGLMIGPSAQTFRMKQAARADIDRQVGTKANDVVALKNVLKGEGDWNRDRIGMLFGQERADKAISLLDREVRFDNTKNKVTGNSSTKARIAAEKDLYPDDVPAFGMKEAYAAGGMSGAVRSAGTRLADRVMKGIADGSIDARDISLGRALSGQRQDVVDALLKIQDHLKKVPNSQAKEIIRALFLNGGLMGARLSEPK